MKFISILFLIALYVSSGCNVVTSKTEDATGGSESAHDFHTFASKPPMGWNSFDAYDSRIDEKDFRATVDYMAENLKQYGWEYLTIDYIWWHPEPGSWKSENRKGHPNIRYKTNGEVLYPEYTTMDEYGRLLPSVQRFPSSQGGKGFKPLADYVHSKGLKFGIHIMRGIHRYAWFKDTPVLGSEFSARDFAETYDTCKWCNHMYGVDKSKPGSQEYYNSLFNLYADWGVDLVKADDMMVPKYHAGEIEMMRKAIDQCGRPMVLSLSCGEAPMSFANHMVENANMWRISNDFWDNWKALRHNFDLLHAWSSFIGEGHWPDADMLPIGKLSLEDRPHGVERMTEFSKNEQYTLMNLWCIARSPLILGADLLSMDEFTLNLISNKAVLDVNQNSENNRQIDFSFGQADFRIWFADIPDSEDKYFAMFNLADQAQDVTFYFEFEELREEYHIVNLWTGEDLGSFETCFTQNLPAHGSGLYRLMRE